MMLLRRFLGLFLLLGVFLGDSAFAQESIRQVTIPWREVDGAEIYEFQISNKPEMDPEIIRKKVKETQMVLSLKKGTYFFRVRGFDKKNLPGPWTEVEGFSIYDSPPQLKSPIHKIRFRKFLPDQGIHFEWGSEAGDTEYVFEIQDHKGVVLNRKVNGRDLWWKPSFPGIYGWRVGFPTPSGVQWSERRLFGVNREAIELPSGEPAEWSLRRMGDRQEFWFLPKASQSVLFYRIDDTANAVKSSSVSLTAGLGGEMRFFTSREPDASKRWMFFGGFSMLRHVLGKEQFIVPSGSFRLLYSATKGNWRWGPFLHSGYRKIPIYAAKGGVVKRTTTAGRYEGGLGIQSFYYLKQKVYFRGLGLVRADFGGQVAGESQGIDRGWGADAGVGPGFLLSEDRFLIEIMLNAHLESNSWQNSFKKQTTVGLTQILLDIAIGFRL